MSKAGRFGERLGQKIMCNGAVICDIWQKREAGSLKRDVAGQF